MFTWTTETVLDFIDAGVAEVIATFNRAFTMHWTNAPMPARNAHNAYFVAMAQTVATLNAAEDLGYDETGSEFETAVWDLVTNGTPDNFGIERDAIPMFTTIVA